MTTQQDWIERDIWIDAPPASVWAALVDSGEFGRWFGCVVDGPFTAGGEVTVSMPQYPDMKPFWLRPVELVPPHRFAFDWPAGDPAATRSPDEPATRVTVTLTAERGGTQVRVVEAGFAALPAEMAERKLRDNTRGWEIQLGNLAAHVAP
ncbi:MAG: SRPBCC domain-containing protein [Rhodobacteraceae bacterium]|nr:SRPBCC domain-containing protein [Paracoccaceae bacterium]